MSLDYVDFDRAYAAQSNQQLLLNLARLANDDPVNFLQLGSFSSQYQYGAGLGFTPSYAMNHPSYYNSGTTTTTGSTPPTGGSTLTHSIGEFFENTLTLGANASISASSTPNFQYLPLAGSNIVSALTTPISPNIFYEYYDQGWPADLLARLMVASVAIQSSVNTRFSTNVSTNFFIQYDEILYTNYSYMATNILGNVSIYTNIDYGVTNVPVGIGTNITTKIAITTVTNYQYYVNRPSDPTYPDFLCFCDQLKTAQDYHYLTVGSDSSGQRVVYSNKNETNLTGIVAAVQANLTVKWDTNNNQVLISQAPQQADAFIENTNVSPPEFSTNQAPPVETKEIVSTEFHLLPLLGTAPNALPLLGAEPNVSDNIFEQSLLPELAVSTASAGEFLAVGFRVEYKNNYATNLFQTIDITRGLTAGYKQEDNRFLPITNVSETITSRNELTEIVHTYEMQSRDSVLRSSAKSLAIGFKHKVSLKMRTVEAAMYTAANEEGHYRELTNNAANSFIISNILGLTNAKRLEVFTNTVYPGTLQKSYSWILSANYSGLLITNYNISPNTNYYGIINKNRNGVLATNYCWLLDTNYYGILTSNINGLVTNYCWLVNTDSYELLNTSNTSITEPNYNVVLNAKYAGLLSANYFTTLSTNVYGIVTTNDSGCLTTNYCWLMGTNYSGFIYRNNYWVLNPHYFWLTNGFTDDLQRSHVVYFESDRGPYAIIAQINEVPYVVRPLLRMTSIDGEQKPQNILTEVSYGDDDSKEYFIGDPPHVAQDREVFTLLTYLFTQTAVNTQNLPVQQLIQVQ